MKKDNIVAILATFCLTAALFMVSSSLGYDPWADINDDGAIEMKDVGYSARLYGTSGDPTKRVEIQGYNWSVQSYSVDVPPWQTRGLNISTDGFRQITVGFYGENPSLGYAEAPISINFLLANRHANVDMFNLDLVQSESREVNNLIPIGSESYEANTMWIEPSQMEIPAIAGYRFNFTAWINLSQSSYTWLTKMLFNTLYFRALRVGPTAGATSEFFTGHTIVPFTNIDNTAGYVQTGETLLGTDQRLPGYGSLCWVEFELVAIPAITQAFSLHNTDSYALDPSLSEIPTAKHGSTVWVGEGPWSQHIVVKTYQIIGPVLRILCANPTDSNITLEVEAYLTT